MLPLSKKVPYEPLFPFRSYQDKPYRGKSPCRPSYRIRIRAMTAFEKTFSILDVYVELRKIYEKIEVLQESLDKFVSPKEEDHDSSLNSLLQNQFIREPECLKVTGLSRTTRWRLEKTGEFPKRRKISESTVGWLSSDLKAWINNRSMVFKEEGAPFLPGNHDSSLNPSTYKAYDHPPYTIPMFEFMIGLSDRSQRAIAGCFWPDETDSYLERTIKDLVQKSESEMLRTPNFGRKSLNEIKEKLGKLGLAFGMEIPNE